MNYTICFDIGGTRIKYGAISEGKVLHSDFVDIVDNSQLSPILIVMEGIIAEYQSSDKIEGELIGIGIALPCFIDSKNKKVLSHYVKYNDASNIDLEEWANSKWGVSVAIQNDAKAALMGEWQYGVGQNIDNLAMITLGTGIGSAVLIEGRLLNGKDFLAGNLWGHSTIDFNGPRCNCGSVGCAEALASTWSLKDKELLNNSDSDHIDFKFLFDKASNGPNEYKELLDEIMTVWAHVVINIILAYNPESIIFAGGVVENHEVIFPKIKKIIDEHGWIDSDIVKLQRAKQKDFAALLGLHYQSLESMEKVVS